MSQTIMSIMSDTYQLYYSAYMILESPQSPEYEISRMSGKNHKIPLTKKYSFTASLILLTVQSVARHYICLKIWC